MNAETAKQVADLLESLPHSPRSFDVRRAYQAFKAETALQFTFAQGLGIVFEPWTREGQPYQDSAAMIRDVRANSHLFFFTGGDFPDDHPLRETFPYFAGLTFNDAFRAIHDYFGHSRRGNSFSFNGETQAWLDHAAMFTDAALPALTAETQGQTSWFNFGRHLRRPDGSVPVKGDQDFRPMNARPYAEQKASVFPLAFCHAIISAEAR